MTVVKQSRIVQYSCEQMFNLVNDIEKYNQFLPYFEKCIVHYQDEDVVEASCFIKAGGITKSFTTRNRLQAHKMIEIRLVDGPFSHLEGFWRFDEEPKGCKVSFDLEFVFSSRMIAMFVGPIFEQITTKMVDAFCSRAKELYD